MLSRSRATFSATTPARRTAMIAIQTAPPATRRCATAFWERDLGRDRGLARSALATATAISASSGDVAASLAREKPGRLRTQGASISKRYGRGLRLQTGGALQPPEARMTLPGGAPKLSSAPRARGLRRANP